MTAGINGDNDNGGSGGMITDGELCRALRAESAERRRRAMADPRVIVHCHWCMGMAQTSLLDPAWRRAGDRSGRVVLLCGRCARHVRAFMRGRGYEMVRTDNRRGMQIMEEVAAMKADAAPEPGNEGERSGDAENG